MRRALLLLPRLQPCSPAVARTFSSKASVTLQTPDAEVDATEDHSRESMVSSDLDKHLRKFDEIALSEYFCARISVLFQPLPSGCQHCCSYGGALEWPPLHQSQVSSCLTRPASSYSR